MPKTFLVVANSRTQLTELRRVVRLVRGRGSIARLFVQAAALLDEPQSEPYPDSSLSSLPLPRTVRRLLGERQTSKRLLADVRPDGLIVAEDGLGGPLPIIVEAKRARVPVYVVPYEFSGFQQFQQAFADVPVTTGLKRLALRRAWRTPDGDVIFPFSAALAYDLAGLSPPNPYTVHGGVADVLLSESAAMTAHYQGEGVTKRIVETGALGLDELAAAMAKAKPSAHKPRILLAIPPDYPSRRTGDYATLIREWIDVASRHGDLTLQAHPAAREALAALGLPLDTRDIVQLIAECDIFTTSVSSVIRYAIAAGKPVINYDLYDFDYPDYKGVSTVAHVQAMPELDSALSDATNNLSSFQEVAATIAPLWGALDGKAHERVASVLGL